MQKIQHFKADAEFWSPVIIALGITAFFNGITTSIKLSSLGKCEWENLTVTIILYIIGVFLVICGFRLSTKIKDIITKLLFTSGISLLIIGLSNYYLSHCFGLITIGISLISLVIGIGTIACRKQK